MPEEKIITVDRHGGLHFVYDDKLRGLLRQGDAKISRASHVEPCEDGRWAADLSPVGGPVLGPYETREEALKNDVNWLNQNNLGRRTSDPAEADQSPTR